MVARRARLSAFRLREVPRGVPEKKIEVDRGDWSALKGGRGVADKDRIELDLDQPAGDLSEQRRGVHRQDYSVPLRAACRAAAPPSEARSAEAIVCYLSKVVHC